MDRKEPILENEYYHIYNRGNRRQQIFLNEADYLFFLRRLKEYSFRYKIFIHVHCLMPNHYHLISSQDSGGSIPAFMATLATSFTKRHNLKYNRVGHLFQGPYKYKRVSSDDYLVRLSCYIHANPVLAGLVKKPEDWRYSNYAQFAGSSERNIISLKDDDLYPKDRTDPSPILDRFENNKTEYAKCVCKFLEEKKLTFRLENSRVEG